MICMIILNIKADKNLYYNNRKTLRHFKLVEKSQKLDGLWETTQTISYSAISRLRSK